MVVSVAMFKALLRMGVAAGAKAAAEPMRREAIASFMLTVYLRVGIVRVAAAAEDCSSGASDEAVERGVLHIDEASYVAFKS